MEDCPPLVVHRLLVLLYLGWVIRHFVLYHRAMASQPVKEISEAKLFVGFLPQSVNDDRLRERFLPFGSICEAAGDQGQEHWFEQRLRLC